MREVELLLMQVKRRHQKTKLLKKLKWGGIPPVPESEYEKTEYGQISMSEVLGVMGADAEELTPELCAELVETRGYVLEDLQKYKAMGFAYNRSRNSFVSEPEFFGFDS